MKKLMLFTILGTFLINSYAQTDTLAYSISGKEKFEFDYYSSEVKKITWLFVGVLFIINFIKWDLAQIC